MFKLYKQIRANLRRNGLIDDIASLCHSALYKHCAIHKLEYVPYKTIRDHIAKQGMGYAELLEFKNEIETNPTQVITDEYANWKANRH